MFFKKSNLPNKPFNPVGKKEINLQSNLAHMSYPSSNFNQFSPLNINSSHNLKNIYGLNIESDKGIDHIISSNIRVSFSNTNTNNKKS